MPRDLSNIHIKPLRSDFHQRRGFSCEIQKIQNFCHNNIHKQHDAYQIRAFVACDGTSPDIVGFYYLCISSYELGQVDDKSDKKFDRVQAVPAVYLGMIAVDNTWRRSGLGPMLMAHAIHTTAEIADRAGTYALTLDALDEKLAAYYRQYDFESFKGGPTGLEMFLPVKKLLRAIQTASSQDQTVSEEAKP